MADERRLGKVRISSHLMMQMLGLDPYVHTLLGTTDYDLEFTSRAVTVVIEGEKMPKVIRGEELERVEPSIDKDGLHWPDRED